MLSHLSVKLLSNIFNSKVVYSLIQKASLIEWELIYPDPYHFLSNETVYIDIMM